MPLVSAIIPTFNRAHTLERAISSVIGQSFRDLECLIVDDGSTDETRALVERMQFHDKRIKYIKSINKGVSAARNLGFSQSSGKWIALLDSDDQWLPQKLEKQLDLAKREPKIPLIHAEEIWIRNGKRVNPKFKHKKEGGYIFERSLSLCLISPSAALIKRSLFEEMKGFREDFIVCEDYELWLRVTQKYNIGFIKDPVLNKYGGHDDQLSHKYKAMDYWRIKAMSELYNDKNFQLTQREKRALCDVLLEKCRILKLGYIKHANLEHMPYLNSLSEEFSSISESLSMC